MEVRLTLAEALALLGDASARGVAAPGAPDADALASAYRKLLGAVKAVQGGKVGW